MQKISSNNYFFTVFKGVGIAFIFTIICLTVFSFLLVYTNTSESLIQPVVIGVTGISILFGSFIANKKRNKNGIINGIIIGSIYIFLIYIVSSVVNNGNFNLNFGAIIMMAVGIICGAIGGVMGVNI